MERNDHQVKESPTCIGCRVLDVAAASSDLSTDNSDRYAASDAAASWPSEVAEVKVGVMTVTIVEVI